ncbi:MAG: DUF2341 domain-containing protein [Candidatus Dojkabacteria bacterium]|nr:DUF2341 domain-containing protein [Candidatus Dojkabacteria bacterium]
MKISKNTLIIGASILAVVGGVAGYYLLTQDEPETLGWMNSSWLYRKAITVSNSGSELLNEDVLVTIDTESLIDASKLQSDCDDLRFTDSDETTALDYWVEGGCDTSTTRVWVQIPTLPNGGKTIYVYYANPSATNSEETWSEYFIALNDEACPAGWTRDSNFDDAFPLASATAKTAGGSNTHSHTASGSTSSQNQGCQNGTGQQYGYGSHGWSSSVTNDTKYPPYLDMVFCKNSDYNPYAGMITLFDATVPSGWTRYSGLDSYFTRGAASYSATPGGATTHTHSFSGGTTGGSGSGATSGLCFTTSCVLSHSHSFSITSVGSGSSLPQYKTVIWGEADGATVLDEVIFMVTGNPPLGWSTQSTLNGYYLYGSSSYNSSGGDASHTHSVSGSTGSTSSSNCCGNAPLNYGFGTSASHSIAATTSSAANNTPAYYSVIISKRKASVSTSLGTEESQNTAPDAPSAPYCESTTNPTLVTDSTPEFSAVFTDDDSSDTGNYYQIQVNTASDFSGTSMWDSTKTAFGTPITNGARCSDISYDGSTLSWGTQYYWRIKFWDNQSMNNESDWSTTQNFTMNAIPTSTAPYCEQTTNPTKVTDSTPEFSSVFTDTDSGDTGNSYEIEVNTTSAFDGTSMWDTGKTSIASPLTSTSRSIDYSYAGTALDAGVTYYWRMRFWDVNDEETPYSTTGLVGQWDFNETSGTTADNEGSCGSLCDGTLTNMVTTGQDDSSSSGWTYDKRKWGAGAVMFDGGNDKITMGDNTNLELANITVAAWIKVSSSTGWTRIAGKYSSTNKLGYNLTIDGANNGKPVFQAGNSSTTASASLVGTSVYDDEWHYIVGTADGTDVNIYMDGEFLSSTSFASSISYGTEVFYIGSNGTTAVNGTVDHVTIYSRALSEEEILTNYQTGAGGGSWSTTSTFVMSGPPSKPTNLKTDAQTNPTQLASAHPMFSATYSDPNSDDSSAYEIEVNAASNFLGTVMWDTGKTAKTITSGTTGDIVNYAGTPLSNSTTTYYWRIRFWDTDDTESEWSDTAQFSDFYPSFKFQGIGMEGLKIN